ncbi:MAG: GNAT family N-acetyltransferase [Clostridiales bacterium]|nr:GNAT family N-acetyltransferase [Clostridiales bacterium]
MISLTMANMSDCCEIHSMQVAAFRDLLDKYQDVKTNPAAETAEHVAARMEQESTTYYLITLNGCRIGAIGVVSLQGNQSRISPMYILPEFQVKGYAQQALRKVEALYPDTAIWKLDTIKQERSLCHLYEKMGYAATGKEETIQEGMDIIFYEKIVAE